MLEQAASSGGLRNEALSCSGYYQRPIRRVHASERAHTRTTDEPEVTAAASQPAQSWRGRGFGGARAEELDHNIADWSCFGDTQRIASRTARRLDGAPWVQAPALWSRPRNFGTARFSQHTQREREAPAPLWREGRDIQAHTLECYSMARCRPRSEPRIDGVLVARDSGGVQAGSMALACLASGDGRRCFRPRSVQSLVALSSCLPPTVPRSQRGYISTRPSRESSSLVLNTLVTTRVVWASRVVGRYSSHSPAAAPGSSSSS